MALFIVGFLAIVAIFAVHIFSDRSEEHTSELQSLMRISYAVFCFKKKKKIKKNQLQTRNHDNNRQIPRNVILAKIRIQIKHTRNNRHSEALYLITLITV